LPIATLFVAAGSEIIPAYIKEKKTRYQIKHFINLQGRIDTDEACLHFKPELQGIDHGRKRSITGQINNAYLHAAMVFNAEGQG
jgi:hypothetical protein